MNRNLILLIAAGALGLILVSLAVNRGHLPGMAPHVPADTQSLTDTAAAAAAKAMVAQALAYMDKHGTAALIEAVNADVPAFHEGEFYVFVLDSAGTIVAHPIDSRWVGVGDRTGRDADGHMFLARMAATATENPDGSWFGYRWPHPITGKASAKSSWVVMRDNHVVGVGIYLD